MTDPQVENNPTPYYEDAWCTIYHGSALDVLPHLAADVILTDFPYGIGVEYGQFEDTPESLDGLIAEALPLMFDAAPTVALTCGIANIWRYPAATWALCWFQSNAPTARGRWGFNQWQPVLVYGKDPYLVRGMGGRSDAVSIGASGKDLVAVRNSVHPCPKPFQPWVKILARVSPEATDLVLDPFMGSGTTLLAAKHLGRKAVGIELEERFCDLAASRLSQTALDFGGAA